MSLCKAIYYGKEKREPFRGSKAFDYSCCNHKSCVYCRQNRLYQRIRAEQASEEEIVEYLGVYPRNRKARGG